MLATRPASTTAFSTSACVHVLSVSHSGSDIPPQAPASQAIFRIHSAVCALFREALVARDFIEIQSSKFQESGTESGAAVFKVDYFRRPAFLAQSPQLAKQMCIAADMERVFEIGPGTRFFLFSSRFRCGDLSDRSPPS